MRLALEVMFEGMQGAGDLGRVDSNGLPSGGGQILRIGDALTLAYQPSKGSSSVGTITLEWCGGSDADMVADAAVAVVLQAAGQPPALPAFEVQRHKALAAGDAAAAEAAELGILTSLLGAQFGPARVDADQGLIFVEVDGQHVVVNSKSGKVRCADDVLRGRVEKALGRMQAALSPLDVSDLT